MPVEEENYKGYTIQCRESENGWMALIFRPATNEALPGASRATKVEGKLVLLARARERIDNEQPGAPADAAPPS